MKTNKYTQEEINALSKAIVNLNKTSLSQSSKAALRGSFKARINNLISFKPKEGLTPGPLHTSNKVKGGNK